MTATITVKIDLDANEQLPSEAAAVQQLQDQLAAVGRMPVDELVAIWRQAVEMVQKERRPQRHHHHGRKAPPR